MRVVAVVAAVGTALAAGAVVLVLGSTPSGAESPTPVASLEEVTGTWEAAAGPDAPAELAEPVRLTFGDGGVFVETGCNTGRGAATVTDGALVIRTLATTRRACGAPLDAQEVWVLAMLEAGPGISSAGPDEVVLTWGDDDELVLARVADAGTGPTPRV